MYLSVSQVMFVRFRAAQPSKTVVSMHLELQDIMLPEWLCPSVVGMCSAGEYGCAHACREAVMCLRAREFEQQVPGAAERHVKSTP